MTILSLQAEIPLQIRSKSFTDVHRMGIPYQTFISSILHQYLHGELVFRKTVEMLKGLLKKAS
ncbi:MAG: hypothetical protein HY391_04440 [Deltaproteobacteria bacterium]|nr:hypothetical protein [Deltaproteobacteria bacterium]